MLMVTFTQVSKAMDSICLTTSFSTAQVCVSRGKLFHFRPTCEM